VDVGVDPQYGAVAEVVARREQPLAGRDHAVAVGGRHGEVRGEHTRPPVPQGEVAPGRVPPLEVDGRPVYADLERRVPVVADA